MNLFEIDETILNALENIEIDEETGEIKNAEELEELQVLREKKIENIGKYILNLKVDFEAYREQERKFQNLKKQTEAKIEYLKNMLSKSLSGENFKTTEINISFRKSASLIIDDLDKIDKEYISYEPKPDKTALKQAIEAGKPLDGCHIEEKKNISVR